VEPLLHHSTIEATSKKNDKQQCRKHLNNEKDQ